MIKSASSSLLKNIIDFIIVYFSTDVYDNAMWMGKYFVRVMYKCFVYF